MSWTDKQSIKHIKELRDIFKIKTFVETGTFKGINAELHSNNFKKVMTCEKNKKYFEDGQKRLKNIKNVIHVNEESQYFLKRFNHDEYIIFYLDAHFYDPSLSDDKRFVVLDELDALRGRKNSIIIIHDFDNNLGHITYDNQTLTLELMKLKLLHINKDFKFYTNDIDSCDPVKPIIKDMKKAGLHIDEETLDNIEYAWSKPRLTYRGFLYCIPEEVNIKGLKKIKWKKNLI